MKEFKEFEHLIEEVEDNRCEWSGIWIFLNVGYSLNGFHNIHTDTIEDGISQLKQVVKCNCDECKQ